MENTFECVNCGLKHGAEQVLNNGACVECGQNIISYTQDAASEIVSLHKEIERLDKKLFDAHDKNHKVYIECNDLRDTLKIAQQCLDGDEPIQAFEMAVADLEYEATHEGANQLFTRINR